MRGAPSESSLKELVHPEEQRCIYQAMDSLTYGKSLWRYGRECEEICGQVYRPPTYFEIGGARTS